MLQASWGEDGLARLQREWESVNFFNNLPETEGFARASHATICQRERHEPLPPGMPLKQLLRSPLSAWSGLRDRWRQTRYRHQGTYEDERPLLLYHRDQELQLRRAIQVQS